jgi:hypothetical protein
VLYGFFTIIENAKGIFGIIFEIRGASCECVDCGLIMEKDKGLFVKLEFPLIN